MKGYMSDVPHDRYTQLHECKRDIQFELPTAHVDVHRHDIVIRLSYEDATSLLRSLTARASR